MRLALAAVGVTLSLHALAAQNSSLAPHDTGAITIHAATMIDGRGTESRDAFVTVRAGKIE